MQISLHPECRGKPARDARINLGRGWITVDTDWPTAWSLITQDGYATAAALRSDHRVAAEFVSRELIMIDIDRDMTIPELLEHEFYNTWGAGFYVTPSHTWQQHRFRICFLLPEAETDPTRLRAITLGLMTVFDAADEACKDPVRLFYGTPACECCERRDQRLTPDRVTWLIAQAPQPREHTESVLPARPLTDPERERILALLEGTYVGEYTQWRNIGWGLRAGGFDVEDFVRVTRGMMREKTAAQARELWRAGREGGGITMGTVRHFLRQRHGPDCLRVSHTQHLADVSQAIIDRYNNRKAMTHEATNSTSRIK